jgi:hypothetical protein
VLDDAFELLAAAIEARQKLPVEPRKPPRGHFEHLALNAID